jgi:hypothetical protein
MDDPLQIIVAERLAIRRNLEMAGLEFIWDHGRDAGARPRLERRPADIST